MNKTKRKIFETSMKLFAEKGYDATSIEEITATVGVAKGTLYYHFSSKEEIFNFLIEEGVKLLKNSIAIKTENLENSIDKIRAIVLIQIKVLVKYESFMTIILSQIWGNDSRSQMCRNYVFDYIQMIEEIVKKGIQKGEIVEGDPNVIASGIFGFTCSSLIYKMRHQEEVDMAVLDKEIEKIFIKKLKSNPSSETFCV
ncbi:MAG: TetR/AcrR family transcriptional regulator [Clostridia bacterium]|nr:TetR/AcrR family transcriptional regulator [Clostridia bacterium]